MSMKFYLLLLLTFYSILSFSQQLKSYDQTIEGTGTSFKMIAIPAGKFKIGNANPSAEADEMPQKEIQLSSFWMEEHEVTFEEWDLYFKDVTLPQSKVIDGVTRATPQYIDLTWGMGRDSKHPTNSMSQQAAMMYCKWLYSKTGFFYRLPTEAEWEYACKANNSSSDDPNTLLEKAFFKSNADAKYHHIKGKKPNAWGLYDMLGNLSEWTIDQYTADYYQKISIKDPTTTPGSKYPRTMRGGSYLDEASQLSCTNRIPSDAKWNQRDPQIPKSRWWLTDGMFAGFRVVRPVQQPSADEIEKFYAMYLK